MSSAVFWSSRLQKGLVAGLPPIESLRREVAGICGTDMRVDFGLTHPGGSRTALEVKTVVDADVDFGEPTRTSKGNGKTKAAAAPEPAPDAAETSAPAGHPASGADRKCTAIFPVSIKCGQKGPDGEPVVSARAIKHADCLTSIATGVAREAGGERLAAAILFMVLRGDAVAFRANQGGCPSFARHLRAAHAAGVSIRVEQVSWGTGMDEGRAYAAGPLPIE